MAASLPPRPKSPLPSLTVRDRDVASAQPMASRPREDRHPPNRSSDTYIPSYREGRRDDRDRDRYRGHDRRDRYRRDYSPPLRRRDSLDRDRRPPPRDPPRRRGYHYSSRSRSPPFHRSPSPRKYRSRTRSRSRDSPRPQRLAQNSVANSSRGHSPSKRRYSRSRSHTPSKPRVRRSWAEETDSKADILDSSIPPLKKERLLTPPQSFENHSIKKEESDVSLSQPHSDPPPNDPVAIKSESPKIKSEETRTSVAVEDEVTSESRDTWRPEVKMDVDSPIPPTWTSRFPPRISSVDDRTTGSSAYRARSPPKGPRAYGNHSRVNNTHSHPSAPGGSQQSYASGSRLSKRKPHGVFNRDSKKYIHMTEGDPVELPVKKSHPIIDEMDRIVAGTRRTASKLTMEILQQSKHLSKQLHEFQLARIDLRAAESRRKMSDLHLEKARNGTLGIDYSEETKS